MKEGKSRPNAILHVKCLIMNGDNAILLVVFEIMILLVHCVRSVWSTNRLNPILLVRCEGQLT